MEEAKTDARPSHNARRKRVGLLILGVTVLIGIVALLVYLRYKATHITTDNAFIEGRVHTISAKIRGSVIGVHVQDNEGVKKGDLLIEIDPADYAVRVSEARAGVTAEQSKLSEVEARIRVVSVQREELKASVEAARAQLALQEANLEQAKKDAARAENLFARGTISKDRYEKAQTAYSVAAAQAKAAREQLTQAEKALETQMEVLKQTEALRNAQRAAIKEKEAKLAAAELNYGYTKIFAPSDGYVTKKAVELGNHVEVGQPLMAIVDLDDIWVVANYKETQLEKVRPGQKVRFTVDSYPGRTFTGRVESIMSGTGAVFSLFPPENATGNYVKVVQRIPVKIVLDQGADRDCVLRIGMSVIPTILVNE